MTNNTNKSLLGACAVVALLTWGNVAASDEADVLQTDREIAEDNIQQGWTPLKELPYLEFKAEFATGVTGITSPLQFFRVLVVQDHECADTLPAHSTYETDWEIDEEKAYDDRAIHLDAKYRAGTMPSNWEECWASTAVETVKKLDEFTEAPTIAGKVLYLGDYVFEDPIDGGINNHGGEPHFKIKAFDTRGNVLNTWSTRCQGTHKDSASGNCNVYLQLDVTTVAVEIRGKDIDVWADDPVDMFYNAAAQESIITTNLEATGFTSHQTNGACLRVNYGDWCKFSGEGDGWGPEDLGLKIMMM